MLAKISALTISEVLMRRDNQPSFQVTREHELSLRKYDFSQKIAIFASFKGQTK